MGNTIDFIKHRLGIAAVHRTDKTGQFVLEVEKPADNADAVFEEAQAAEERSDIATAERLYRRVIKMDPAGPAAPFNLGNVLRSSGRTFEAEAAYREAVRADPNFASAWYNLADVLDDQRRNAEAIECLKRALDADPTYADAMFNMGLLVFYSAGDNSRSSARDGLERSRRRACAFALFS